MQLYFNEINPFAKAIYKKQIVYLYFTFYPSSSGVCVWGGGAKPQTNLCCNLKNLAGL